MTTVISFFRPLFFFLIVGFVARTALSLVLVICYFVNAYNGLSIRNFLELALYVISYISFAERRSVINLLPGWVDSLNEDLTPVILQLLNGDRSAHLAACVGVNKYNKIKEIWAANKNEVSKTNLLHPIQYEFIGSSKVRELIMDIDLHKYNTRKTRAVNAVNNWAKEDNRLHKGKKFRGNWTSKNPGALPREIVNTIKSFHGVKELSYTNARLAGFADGEFSLSVYLKNDGYTSVQIGGSQNMRNRHLMTGVQDFFNAGGFYTGMWNNSSGMEWKSNGYKTNMTTVASKLAEVPFQTVKAKQKMLFLGRIDAYKRKVPHSEIRRLYRFTQNKEKLTNPKRSDDLPDTLLDRYPDWVVGTFDRDGSITREGSNRYYRWKQKDPYLRELVMNYFEGKGSLGNSTVHSAGAYEIDYKKNYRSIDTLFKQCRPVRTDLVFKHSYLKHCGFVDLNNIRKLPEYVPRRRQVFHRIKANGVILPDRLIEVLEMYYPMELLLYYKEIYSNICYKYDIPVSVLPFSDL